MERLHQDIGMMGYIVLGGWWEFDGWVLIDVGMPEMWWECITGIVSQADSILLMWITNWNIQMSIEGFELFWCQHLEGMCGHVVVVFISDVSVYWEWMVSLWRHQTYNMVYSQRALPTACRKQGKAVVPKCNISCIFHKQHNAPLIKSWEIRHNT